MHCLLNSTLDQRSFQPSDCITCTCTCKECWRVKKVAHLCILPTTRLHSTILECVIHSTVTQRTPPLPASTTTSLCPAARRFLTYPIHINNAFLSWGSFRGESDQRPKKSWDDEKQLNILACVAWLVRLRYRHRPGLWGMRRVRGARKLKCVCVDGTAWENPVPLLGSSPSMGFST